MTLQEKAKRVYKTILAMPISQFTKFVAWNRVHNGGKAIFRVVKHPEDHPEEFARVARYLAEKAITGE